MAVTPENIAVELGRPTPTTEQSVQWQSWIDKALFLLRFGDGTHSGLGDLTLLDSEAVDYVVLEAVTAHVRNPENATQVDVRIDDAATSKRYSSGAGRITILDEWWDMLTPATDGFGGAFTISPFGAADRVGDGPTGWVR